MIENGLPAPWSLKEIVHLEPELPVSRVPVPLPRLHWLAPQAEPRMHQPIPSSPAAESPLQRALRLRDGPARSGLRGRHNSGTSGLAVESAQWRLLLDQCQWRGTDDGGSYQSRTLLGLLVL